MKEPKEQKRKTGAITRAALRNTLPGTLPKTLPRTLRKANPKRFISRSKRRLPNGRPKPISRRSKRPLAGGKKRVASVGGRPARTFLFNDFNHSHMADYCGVTESYISKLLYGKGQPNLTLAAKMAAYVGMPLEELVETLRLAREQRRKLDEVRKLAKKELVANG